MSRTLFVGDVHSCADELRDLIDLARPTRVILVGDVFNKGPKPAETWAVVEAVGAECVLGNHDVWVIESHARAPGVLAPQAAVTWLEGLPLFIEGDGWLAIHAGIDPERGVAGTTRERATSMRRWPDDTDDTHRFWWEAYEGPPLVIYGHDAIRGLQDRRPHSLGLDTGCVYGGQLTGFLLETGHLISVPARAAYRPV